MAPPNTPTRPLDVVPELLEDVPAARSGVITGIAEAARAARDALGPETPPDGSQAVAVATATATTAKPPRSTRKRPGWAALALAAIGTGVASPPAWELASGSRSDIAALRGENTVMRENIAAIQTRLDRGYARDLEAAADGAIEFRELDSKVAAVWALMGSVALKVGVPANEIPALPPTSEETLTRHDDAIRARNEARRRAASMALERAVSEADMVTGP